MNSLHFRNFIFLLFTFMLSLPSFGQATFDRDYVLGNLDLSQVPSGLLLERSIPFIPLDSFNGVFNSDTNFVSPLRFKLIYATLSGAAVDTSYALPHPSTFPEPSNSDTVELKLILEEYNTMKPWAIDSNLFDTINNQIFDVPNRLISPYESKIAFAGIPNVNRSINASSIHFKLKKTEDIITNMLWDIQKIEVDFDNGDGFIGFNTARLKEVSYNNSGCYTITFKVTLTNSDILYSFSKICVEIPDNNRNFDPENATLLEGIPNTSPLDTISLISSCNDGLIRKPLIIIEGFSLPPNTDLSLPGENGDGFEIAMDNFIANTLTGLRFESPQGILGTIIENAEYDLIYIDFEDGSRPLEENAEIVKSVIREVNAMKEATGSSEENVVIGISMGGVLGKMALREMEIDGEDHETKKLITLDSPLRGANIPLGLQHMLNMLANTTIDIGYIPFFPLPPVTLELSEFIPELGDALFILNNGSAKQMLIHHYAYDIDDPDNPYRTFYDYFKNLGPFQSECEHIAIANGNEVGNSQGFLAQDKLLDADGGLSEILNQIAANSEDFNISNSWANFFEIIGWLGGNGILVDLEVNAVPNQVTGTIYKANGIVFLFTIPVTVLNHNVSVSGTQPIDGAPGGRIALDIAGDFANFEQEGFCFIPTISALGIGPFDKKGEPLISPFIDISDENTVLGLSDIDRYIAWDEAPTNEPEDLNQIHTGFSNDNSIYLLTELLDQAAPLGSTLNQIYNFGEAKDIAFDYKGNNFDIPIRSTEKVIDETLLILSGGKLWINRSGRIGFTNIIENPLNEEGVDDYSLRIKAGFCDNSPTQVRLLNGSEFEIGEWTNVGNQAFVYIENDASVFVEDGMLKINSRSELIIEDGGQLIIGDEGIVQPEFGAKIIVKDGGELIVQSDGILQVMHHSEVIVEDGGKLIFEEDAKINLFDATNGEAVIRIFGELNVGSSFDFAGSGYFEFHQGNQITFSSTPRFVLTGTGKNNRFIRLAEGKMDLGSAELQLYNGMVEFSGGEIFVNSGGKVLVSNVLFENILEGPTDDLGANLGVTAIDPSQFIVSGCTFNNLQSGLNITSISNTTLGNNLVLQSDFNNCYVGIYSYESEILNLRNCIFNGGLNSLSAIWGINTQSLRLGLSTITGYNLPTSQIFNADNWGAIILDNTREFIMTGGSINNNEVGICAPNLGGIRNVSNVFISGHADISNNNIGINIQDGGIDLNDVDFGLVLLDCMNLLNNRIGVKGKDVLLQIDAYENSGTDELQYLRSNHFQNGQQTDAKLFEICYQERNIEQINATGNYWGTDNGNPSNVDVSFLKSGCFLGSGTVLNTNNNVANPLTTCPSVPLTEELPSEKECFISEGGQVYALHDNFQTAMRSFNEKVELEESTNSVKQGFIIPSSISNSVRNTSSQVCKNYIDVSRTMIHETTNVLGIPSQSLASNPSALLEQKTQKKIQYSIYPNPTQNLINIDLEQGDYIIEVYGVNGKKQFSSQVTEKIQISASQFVDGIISIVIINIETGDYVTEKVVINK